MLKPILAYQSTPPPAVQAPRPKLAALPPPVAPPASPDGFTPTTIEMPTVPGSPFDRAYWQRIQQLCNRPIAYSPTVEYLSDGEEAYQHRLRAIAAATSTIALSTYVLEGDKYGLGLLDALTAKAKEGVK